MSSVLYKLLENFLLFFFFLFIARVHCKRVHLDTTFDTETWIEGNRQKIIPIILFFFYVGLFYFIFYIIPQMSLFLFIFTHALNNFLSLFLLPEFSPVRVLFSSYFHSNAANYFHSLCQTPSVIFFLSLRSFHFIHSLLSFEYFLIIFCLLRKPFYNYYLILTTIMTIILMLIETQKIMHLPLILLLMATNTSLSGVK